MLVWLVDRIHGGKRCSSLWALVTNKLVCILLRLRHELIAQNVLEVAADLREVFVLKLEHVDSLQIQVEAFLLVGTLLG